MPSNTDEFSGSIVSGRFPAANPMILGQFVLMGQRRQAGRAWVELSTRSCAEVSRIIVGMRSLE